VSEVVAECADDAAIMAAPRDIQIEQELPPKVMARIDRGRFSQILLNLLDNAVKYNREGGRIRVCVAEDHEAVRILVANTGPGIPAGHSARIFDRFFRADPPPAVEGQGLGLSLARELARAHHGDLTLLRADAEWTGFQFTIPLVSS
jgi:two-component system, OmpR family, heavy metal sensor histidine kinase CusS